jgi:predicted metallopeptidase
MSPKSISLQALKKFASEKSKLVTKKDVSIMIVDMGWHPKKKPTDRGMVGANIGLINVKGIKPYYRIYLDQLVYKTYKTDPEMLKNIILHELAHVPQIASRGAGGWHGKEFKTAAKKLMVPDSHRRAFHKIKK